MYSASKLILILILAACSHLAGTYSQPVHAQAVSELPRTEYYIAKELLRAGRLPEAIDGFKAALSRARRIGETRWIDSIPPLVMLGECYYQQGSLGLALEQYDAALQLALADPRWIDQFDVGLEQLSELEVTARDISWFPQTLVSRSVVVPESVLVTFDVAQLPTAPGNANAVAASLTTRLDATEVMRGMAIALLRRWQVLGPLAEHSPLSAPLSRMFDQPPNQQSAWVNSSWSVLRGISQLAGPMSANAHTTIRSGVLLSNQFDYFMSPVALRSLAEIDARRGNFAAAITLLQDASLFAARYEQYDELANALQQLTSLASASRRTDLLDPILNAVGWCSKRSNLAGIAATAGATELAVYANNLALADRLKNQIAPALGSRDISLPRAQAQADFAGALIAYSQNRSPLGLSKLKAALQFMRGNSQSGAVVESVFQAQLTLNLLAEGRLSATDAEGTLVQVLAEPSAIQWQLAPLRTLASITTASMPAFERLLDFAESRGDQSAIVERLDRLQRQRFYESLPLGGRLLCWRQALKTPPASLPTEVRSVVELTQQTYPNLQESIQRIQAIVQRLRQSPLPLDERRIPPEQKKLFAELTGLADTHENELVFQSLLRKPMDRYLPTSASLPILQASLDEGDLLMALVATRQRLSGIAISRDFVETWQVMEVAGVADQLQSLFVKLGLVSQESARLPSSVLAGDTAWRQHAGKLGDLLFPPNVQSKIAEARRVIIAPQDQLWYVPFELLLLNSAPNAPPWIEQRSIAYIPTLGSLPRANAQQPTINRTLGLVDSFFSLDRERNEQQVQRLLDSVSNSSAIYLKRKTTFPSPLWLRIHYDQFWLAAKMEATANGLDSVVMPLQKPQLSTIGSWLRAPGQVPASVLLPGLQSSIQSGKLLNGDDIFLPACGLLASGVQTALLTRWPVGGKSTNSLLLNYLQELQTEPSSEALRRATLALWTEDFLVAEEPSLPPAGKDAAALTSGAHPILWAGYMSIGDTRPSSASETP